MEIERVADRGDWVVIGVHSLGRGKASGAPIDVRWNAAILLRDGTISRVDVHGDRAKALATAGLGE